VSVRILAGDCRAILRTLPDQSVHCCVTSPPYFGLRDYGVDGQIGLEPTPADFVAEMVAVFREVRRVLRDDGTLWLNLGDSYASNAGGYSDTGSRGKTSAAVSSKTMTAVIKNRRRLPMEGLKAKDLIGIPWRVAFALQADGWYLRSEIIWHKPNPMPESVTDRPTKSHESIFLLSKNASYFYDAEAIAEPSCKGADGSQFDTGKTALHQKGRSQVGERSQTKRARELAEKSGLTSAHFEAIRAVGVTDTGKARSTQDGFGKNTPEQIALAAEAKVALGGYYREFLIGETRNKRSVWTVPTMPFSEAHFATFPPDLIVDCIKAGCPKGGAVLDPFGGAGTTGLVADRLQRDALLIELNPEYADMARRRILGDSTLLGDVA
jgi:DNA modification methylase